MHTEVRYQLLWPVCSYWYVTNWEGRGSCYVPMRRVGKCVLGMRHSALPKCVLANYRSVVFTLALGVSVPDLKIKWEGRGYILHVHCTHTHTHTHAHTSSVNRILKPYSPGSGMLNGMGEKWRK